MQFNCSASGPLAGARRGRMLEVDQYISTERWLSGRKQRFAKPSYGQKLYRGFESPPLRQSFLLPLNPLELPRLQPVWRECNNLAAMSRAPSVMVIVPAYNEGRAVGATIQRLLTAGFRVVVVDDGSRDDTREVVFALPVDYVRHPVNLGQGAALQTGMTYALRAGADIAVHFDADGQHDCQQIARLIAP